MITTNVINALERIKKEWLTPEAVEDLNRTIAQALRFSIVDRIHNKGLDTDGGPIGSYSPRYAEMRERMGLRTDVVDLKVSGDLKNSFVARKTGQTQWSIGFDNAFDAQKASWMEEHFGKEIWSLSADELRQVHNIIQEKINR